MVNDKLLLEWVSSGFRGYWNLVSDRISITPESDEKATVWSGSLLPSLWLSLPGGERCFVKAEAVELSTDESGTSGRIVLYFAELASGSIQFTLEASNLRFQNFTIQWADQPLAIIGLYIGAHAMTTAESRMVPNLDRPFWPDWQAEGVCIPCAKTGPIQSFVRLWDLGQSRIGLGNFAPAMGSPYGAAYPRPLLACGLGGANGWVVFGFKQAPDGALTMTSATNSACLEMLYREDLWGALSGSERVWENFLQIN